MVSIHFMGCVGKGIGTNPQSRVVVLSLSKDRTNETNEVMLKLSVKENSVLISICRCILSTDMARHNEILNKFKDILADGFSFENEAHKSMVRNLFGCHGYMVT